ncbi:MAG TPA: hypothetical protein VMW46_07340 [Candidatus Desulfaltia sp.]|nr:hypothetical protein [Candidatus Desulfaltia sp.]
MKRLFILLAVLCLVSCTTVSQVVRHPDFNYPPTNPAWVMIYDQFIPTYQFVIIGRMTIDATWTTSPREFAWTLQQKAALIGADAIILSPAQIDIYAFNRGTTTQGSATVWGNQVKYSETTRDNTLYIPQITRFGYIIKKIKPESPGLTGKASGNVGIGAKAEANVAKT